MSVPEPVEVKEDSYGSLEKYNLPEENNDRFLWLDVAEDYVYLEWPTELDPEEFVEYFEEGVDWVEDKAVSTYSSEGEKGFGEEHPGLSELLDREDKEIGNYGFIKLSGGEFRLSWIDERENLGTYQAALRLDDISYQELEKRLTETANAADRTVGETLRQARQILKAE